MENVLKSYYSLGSSRVTSLGENLPFGPLLGYFLGEICFVVDILWVQERLDVNVLNFKLSFDEDILTFFCFGNCFGYFFQNLGEFFPKLLVTLGGSDGKESLQPRQLTYKIVGLILLASFFRSILVILVNVKIQKSRISSALKTF